MLLRMACLLLLSIIGCAADDRQEVPVRVDPFTVDDGNWKYMTMLEQDSQKIYIYSYSRDMVKVSPSGTVRMWFKFVPVEHEDVQGPPEPSHLSYFLTREEADCDKGAMRNLVIRDYNWRGEVIRESIESSEWSPIAPETIGYSEYSAACESPQKVGHETWALLKGLGEFFDQATDKKDNR
jgi:hypothetical protein